MRTVRIVADKPYDIEIGDGLIDNCGEQIAELFRPARLALVSDVYAYGRYGKRTLKSLSQAGFDVRVYVAKMGRQMKGLSLVSGLLEFLAQNHFLKTDQVAWLGGGAVGDIAGAASSLYLGGTYLVQIPTTLVAALDSSVGSRAVLDLASGTDMVSAVAQPSLVLCDTAVYGELPEARVLDGVAQMVKYALLGGGTLFKLLESGVTASDYGQLIEQVVRTKSELINHDRYGLSIRHQMRMGEVIGRASISCSKGKLSHGNALAMGLMAAARAAPKMLGVAGCAEQVRAVLDACGLDHKCPFGRGEMLTAIAAKKQRSEAYMSITVPVSVGDCRVVRVTLDEIDLWLRAGGIDD